MKYFTIQIHPTLQCNLACRHCYSDSSPKEKAALDLEALKRFLSFAYDYGFNNISFSGGEPFIYKDLGEVLSLTQALGYQNTVASNGMLLASKKNQESLAYIDLIAISMDGDEKLHDDIRVMNGSFNKMLKGVEILKEKNVNFGFIHTLTHKSWNILIELADFAFNQGAKLFQVHPLEHSGRATELAHDLILSDEDKHRAFILCSYLQAKYEDKMIVQFDMLHKDILTDFPLLVNGFIGKSKTIKKLTEVIDTIVINENGDILPIAYGFNNFFRIGSINNFYPNLFDDFLLHKAEIIEELINQTYMDSIKSMDCEIISWNELLINRSHQYGFALA